MCVCEGREYRSVSVMIGRVVGSERGVWSIGPCSVNVFLLFTIILTCRYSNVVIDIDRAARECRGERKCEKQQQ